MFSMFIYLMIIYFCLFNHFNGYFFICLSFESFIYYRECTTKEHMFNKTILIVPFPYSPSFAVN